MGNYLTCLESCVCMGTRQEVVEVGILLQILKFAISKFLQVRDYRNNVSEQGSNTPPVDGNPVVNRVRLRMSLENVVKDIPLISDNTWTYGDLMVSVT